MNENHLDLLNRYTLSAECTDAYCFRLQAVKKAKQFEVRKLGRKSHESTNSKSVDATKNKKVVDPLKIEAQLAAMRVRAGC